MIPLTVDQVASATGGSLHGVDGGLLIDQVVTDSRADAAGALYVAIAGERVDGHDFAGEACQRGAVAVLSARPMDLPCIVVDDPVLALGRLARWVRTSLLNCTVIGITGSSGKTGTKDILAQVLADHGPTVAAAGSFNTEVGVPLTILRADETTEFLVLEMGMRGIGHIAYLCQVAQPRITALINVGSAHLGVVGTREGIAQAKGEVVEALPPDGVAVLFGDDPIVMEQAARTRARIVTFGVGEACDVRAARVILDEQARARFDLISGDDSAYVALQFHGEHYVVNALAAAAVALSLGLSVESVAASLTAAGSQSKWRMEVHQGPGGRTVINDAYNANPESMRAGLRTLAAMAGGRRTWAVLGDMRELGSESTAEHVAVGRVAAELGISRIVSVGREAEGIHEGATSVGSWGGESLVVENPAEAITLLSREVGADDVVLVKASRSVGLERVAEALLEGGSA